jgi:hypothetical protein
MIKFRTKKLATDWCRVLNSEYNIYCLYDGYFNLIDFKSLEDEQKAIKIMNGFPKIYNCMKGGFKENGTNTRTR